MQTLGDILSGRALADFAGREREVGALLDLLEKDGPLVAHVHGVTGIGKSSLLAAFAAGASGRGARLVRIDCRAVEPTAQGFLLELSTALGEPLSTVEETAQRLSSFGETVVIALDTYEVFYLLDTWIRQVFVPALPTNARMVIAGRNPPSPEWRTAPGWRGLFRSLPLGPFSEKEALAYLAMSGIPPEASIRINRLARGQPLALSMAASIVRSEPERAIEETGLHQVIDGLARSYLEAVPDAITRRALEASSVVRCVTEPLLHALLPDMAPGGTMERLCALPFVEFGRDGLFIHDAVRSAIATSLAARDPDSHRAYRRAAWAFVQDRLRLAGSAALWRYTADLLFLIENPVLREGFFPSGAHPLAVEPATLGDEVAVRRIVAERAAPQLEALMAWWRYRPQGFHIVRDHAGSIRGFYLMARGSELNEAVFAVDPVAAAWRRAAARGPSEAVFCRQWLDRELGEAPSATQAASWVDIKRTYVEMRGSLRWVYLAVADPRPYAEAATRLGFRPLSEPTVDVGGQTLYLFVLDMGPGSVDGWLTELVGAEVAGDDPHAPVEESSRHRPVTPPHEVPLTPGTRFGSYEILSPLGSGGMGEVHRARDTRLGRDVALKVLPEPFAADPDRLARFSREAQVLASLNHPHIGAIYGLEECGGIRALVLELVEGLTLADRIAQAPIPVDEALPIARQIAEALEAAHEQGIIHRDLKPSNIKLRPNGTVKVLDFGLAKVIEPAADGGGRSHSPTITSPAMTRMGVIMGTAAYMSPEQARGKVIDKRTDIWAFGCVLYEALTGQRAFKGDTVTDTLAAVVEHEPDWTALPPSTPAAIQRLLRCCLEKDPTRRPRDSGDARLELDAALAAAKPVVP
jgi:hypothetical protein